MTRADRDGKIRDYVRYLNRVALLAEKGGGRQPNVPSWDSLKGLTQRPGGRSSDGWRSAASSYGAPGVRGISHRMLEVGYRACRLC